MNHLQLYLNKCKKHFVFLLLFLVGTNSAFSLTTFYVDANLGNDELNTGISDSPFQTLAKALNLCVDFDTEYSIELASGSYYLTDEGTSSYNQNSTWLDITINGTGNNTSLLWDNSTGKYWLTGWEIVLGKIEISNLSINLSGTTFLLSYIFKVEADGELDIHDCTFVADPGSKSMVYNLNVANISNCYYEFLDVSNPDFSNIVYTNSISSDISLNPIYTSVDMQETICIYGSESGIDYGSPSSGSNLSFNASTTPFVLTSGNYPNIQLTEGAKISIPSGVSVTSDLISASDDCEMSIGGELEVSDLSIGDNNNLDVTGNVALSTFVSSQDCDITISGTMEYDSISVGVSSMVDLSGTLQKNTTLLKSLSLSTNGIVFLNSASTLFLNGANAYVNARSMTVSNTASVVQNNAASTLYILKLIKIFGNSILRLLEQIYGDYTTEVELEIPRGEFYFFTPPFDQTTNDFGNVMTDIYASGGKDDVWIFYYDESNEASTPTANSWKIMGAGETLEAGKGYSIWYDPYGNTSTAVLNLTNENLFPFIDDSSYDDVITITGSTETAGLNCLGNIYNETLLLPSNDYVKAYYYYTGSQYVAQTGDGQIVTGFPHQSSIEVPSYEGFFAHVTDPSKVSFTTDNLVSSSVSSKSASIYQVQEDNLPSYIKLAMKNSNSYDDMVIRFDSDATYEVDELDIKKLYAGNEKGLIATSVGDADYTILSLPTMVNAPVGQTETIALNLTGVEQGTYEFSVALNNMEEENVDITLYDKASEKQYSISNGNVSIVLDEKRNLDNRFELIIRKSVNVVTGLEDIEVNELLISSKNGQKSIRNVSSNEISINITDSQGRVITQKIVPAKSDLDFMSLQGLYFINYTCGNQNKTIKVVL